MTKWHGGKGSAIKPYDVDKFNKNFEKIFGKKKKEKKNASKNETKRKDVK